MAHRNSFNPQGEKDDKIIAVCADDPEFRDHKDIKDLPPHRLAEIRRFFEDCILLAIINHYLLFTHSSFRFYTSWIFERNFFLR